MPVHSSTARAVLRWTVAPLTAAALLCAPAAGIAAPAKSKKSKAASKAKAKSQQTEEAALAEAREMFERGRAKYDTFDYAGAIELWQQAYAKVPEAQSGVRNAMVYNIALAQEKAYEVDKDPAHLRQAVLLLESWVTQFKSMYKRTPETEGEVNKAQARIDELNGKIQALESGEPLPEPAEETPAEETPAEETPAEVKPADEIEFDSGYTPPPEVLKNRQRIEAENRSEGMIAAGWTVGGIGGLIALGGAGALIGARNSSAGLGGGIGGMALGGAMLVTGGVLLGIGYKKKKALTTQATVSVAPVLAPGFSGGAMQLRF